MTSSLHNATLGMAETLRGTCGETVTYHRGTDSVEVTAVVGNTRFEADDGDGVVMEGQVRDFLIEAAVLVLATELVEPDRGDIIRQTIGSKVLVFEVAGPGGEPCFRPSDPWGETLRIHTIATDTETV